MRLNWSANRIRTELAIRIAARFVFSCPCSKHSPQYVTAHFQARPLLYTEGL